MKAPFPRLLRVQRWLLFAAVFVAPFNVYRRPAGPVNVSMMRACVAALGVSLVIDVVARRRKLMMALSEVKWVIAAMLGFVALDLAENARNVTGLGDTLAGQHAIFFASVLVLGVGAVVLAVPVRKIRLACLASCVLPYGLAVEQWIRGTANQPLPFESLIGSRGGLDIRRSATASGGTIRPAAAFSDPNFLGVFCAVTFMIADQHRRRTSGIERAFAIACQLGSVGVLVICGSRTGLVALFAYVGVAVLLSLGRRHRRLAVAFVIPVAAVLVVVSASAISVVGRGSASISTERHLETRLTAIGVGLAHPIDGIGLGNLGPLLSEPPDRSSSHALPFTLFAEEGILGLLLCGAALALPIVNLGRVSAGASELAFALGLAIALWFYDFTFSIDVSAVWWGLLVARAAQPRPAAALVHRRARARAGPRKPRRLSRRTRATGRR